MCYAATGLFWQLACMPAVGWASSRPHLRRAPWQSQWHPPLTLLLQALQTGRLLQQQRPGQHTGKMMLLPVRQYAGPGRACACSGRTLPMLFRPEDTPALKSFGLRRLKTVAERSAGHRTSSSCLGCMVYPRCTCFPSPRTHCRSFQWTRHLPGLPLAP